ncbi:hypothetical protein F7R05_10520 [Pseudomonas koreensis]|nr:hypothetical protein F7R05_10520 [Pseudomonas koreensis]
MGGEKSHHEPQCTGADGRLRARARRLLLTQHITPRRSCRRLRSFDFEDQDQKIAAFGSSYRECIQ